MKKVITSSLILAAISGNFAYADNLVKETKDTNENIVISAVEKKQNNEVSVSNFTELQNALKDKKPKTINLTENITFTEKDVNELRLVNGKKELLVGQGVFIEGNGNTIDLQNIATITLKGNDIKISNLNIKNGQDLGMQIYNSRNAYLKNVTVESSERYGIFVNGSTVKLENCSTKNNGEGGILISRSRSLNASNCIDSEVEVIDKITHEESKSKVNVSIKNLQMLDGYTQKNKFIVPEDTYIKASAEVKKVCLSDFYLDLFGIEGEDRNIEYKEIEYVIN